MNTRRLTGAIVMALPPRHTFLLRRDRCRGGLSRDCMIKAKVQASASRASVCRDADRARADALNLDPRNKEGAGKAGCPPHPWPVCKGRKHTVVTTGVGGSSGLPCAMVLTVSFVLSSMTSSFLPPSPRGLNGFTRPVGPPKPPRDLTPATGARTTRLRRPQQRRSSRALRSLTGCEARPAISSNAHDIVASTASHPNVRDDRDTPLVRDETAESIRLIWVFSEAEYFSREGWTEKSGTQVICLSGTSGAFLLLAISVLMTVYAISWFKPQQVP